MYCPTVDNGGRDWSQGEKGRTWTLGRKRDHVCVRTHTLLKVKLLMGFPSFIFNTVVSIAVSRSWAFLDLTIGIFVLSCMTVTAKELCGTFTSL